MTEQCKCGHSRGNHSYSRTRKREFCEGTLTARCSCLGYEEAVSEIPATGCEALKEFSRKVNYCPFCGKPIWGEGSNLKTGEGFYSHVAYNKKCCLEIAMTVREMPHRAQKLQKGNET